MAEAPVVHEFNISEPGGPNISVEGNAWFVHSHEFAAYRRWAEAALAEAEARGMRAGIERAAKVAEDWLRIYGGRPIKHVSAAEFATDAVTDIADGIRALATAAPAETEEWGTGWRPIAEAPKDGRMIGVPGGCAYWSPADQCWVSGVGGAYGRQIRWPLTVWKDLTPPQPTATATREDGHA